MTEPLPFPSGEQGCHRILNAIDVIGARWTGSILMAAVRGARRFKEYRALIGGISDSQLTVRLKELQARGLIARTVIPSTPVQITYTLTTAGEELIAALVPLSRWGEQHLAGDDDA
ncbi:helix-turn-helix transcriptional regulator [Micromonospora fiedleri]|uniref:Helix-turn-helix transcriptional regulator n=1 Tax=Micromonospora fiedleri TaxID=1157498 RepID=A0ABS1UKQ8_9ACTN|nr:MULTISPECIES: helix-turn-helix domain-containing protein [Micromonospora]MBL6276934.1 helix-turn-helix transcriptional regulator [Micromonospora fiedleri]WSK43355.1 helix-turn-helix transcriptional regulator [Micromonospora maris]